MQPRTKRWPLIFFTAIIAVILALAFSQRETPSKTVRIGFAGPSLVETNAVLFTITNQNDFPIGYQLSIESASGFSLGRRPEKSGEVYPSNTFTFYVPLPTTPRWRVAGRFWESSPPKLTPVRAAVIGVLQKMKFKRLSEWLGRPPVRGSVIGPEMVGDRPA